MTDLFHSENLAHNKCWGQGESSEVNSPRLPSKPPGSQKSCQGPENMRNEKREVGSSSFSNADKMFQILTTLWRVQEGLRRMRANFLVVKEKRWGQDLGSSPSFLGCVNILGKSLKLSKPQFPLLQRDNNCT